MLNDRPGCFYGLDFPEEFPSQFEPLEACLIVTGVDLESGMPTCTVIETKGANPWEILGMLESECHRRKFTMAVLTHSDNEEDDDEYER